jgi:hypothetical protein
MSINREFDAQRLVWLFYQSQTLRGFKRILRSSGDSRFNAVIAAIDEARNELESELELQIAELHKSFVLSSEEWFDF